MKKVELRETFNTYGRHERVYKVLVGKHGGNRPLGRRRRKQKDNIKIVLKEIGWKGME
jgi:hypothetical protein